MSDNADINNFNFLVGESMEQKETKSSFFKMVKEDFMKNAAKYLTNAIIFAIFFIGSAFFLGFKFTASKLSGALTEPVAQQVAEKMNPKFEELKQTQKDNYDFLNKKIDSILFNQEKGKERLSILGEIEVDKYHTQMIDKSMSLNADHGRKLDIFFHDIIAPDNYTIKKYHEVKDFIDAKSQYKKE